MKKTTLLYLLLIFLSVTPPIYSTLPSKPDGPLNLEGTSQDFVLETKQLKIPGYPTASNPSLFDWDWGVYGKQDHKVWVVKLDKKRRFIRKSSPLV